MIKLLFMCYLVHHQKICKIMANEWLLWKYLCKFMYLKMKSQNIQQWQLNLFIIFCLRWTHGKLESKYIKQSWYNLAIICLTLGSSVSLLIEDVRQPTISIWSSGKLIMKVNQRQSHSKRLEYQIYRFHELCCVTSKANMKGYGHMKHWHKEFDS